MPYISTSRPSYPVWEINPALIETPFHESYHKTTMRERTVEEVLNYYPEQEKWYHVISYPLDEGIGVSFIDVTERKKEEFARALSDERFRTLSEAIPQMV